MEKVDLMTPGWVKETSDELNVDMVFIDETDQALAWWIGAAIGIKHRGVNFVPRLIASQAAKAATRGPNVADLPHCSGSGLALLMMDQVS